MHETQNRKQCLSGVHVAEGRGGALNFFKKWGGAPENFWQPQGGPVNFFWKLLSFNQAPPPPPPPPPPPIISEDSLKTQTPRKIPELKNFVLPEMM